MAWLHLPSTPVGQLHDAVAHKSFHPLKLVLNIDPFPFKEELCFLCKTHFNLFWQLLPQRFQT